MERGKEMPKETNKTKASESKDNKTTAKSTSQTPRGQSRINGQDRFRPQK
ncbi:MAG: hypothetical protein LBV43_15050 [Prevotella sp.]|jgi:hypothetical protein|nr:hypothetical protein [Prevotella sp.]